MCSCVSCGVTQTEIVRVLCTVVHEASLCNLGEEEPQECHSNNAFPHTLTHNVPHLIVESVNLLQTLQVILFLGSIGKSPHTEVVHMCHVCP